MECVRCSPKAAAELRLEPSNSYDERTVAIFSEPGIQMGYASADSAPLIGEWRNDGKVIAVIRAMHVSGAYIRILFGSGVLTLPDPVPDAPKNPPPR